MIIQNESAVEQTGGSFSIRNGVEYDSYVKAIPSSESIREGITHRDLEMRICQALGLREISNLERAPLDKAILVAEIAEKHLSRFQCYLQTIHIQNGGGGSYCISTGRVRVGQQKLVSLFIHEVAHAIHYAIIGNSMVHEQFASELRRIRKDNLDYLKKVYCKAIEHEPSLTIRESLFTRTVRDRISFWVRELSKYSDKIPPAILEEFSSNFASLYALKDNKEYFSEYMTDYLLNPKPSVFTRRVWQLAEAMALDAHPKTLPVATWLDQVEFSCRQGLVGNTSCDTIVWVCDDSCNFILPGINDVLLHRVLQDYIHTNAPAVKTGCRLKPHLFNVPSDLGVCFKKLVLVPDLYAHYGFYHYALKTAGEYGVARIDIPLFFDLNGTSFNDLQSDLKKTDQLLHTTTQRLQRVTFLTPDSYS